MRCGRPEVQALFRSWCKGGEDGRRDKARRSAPWSYLSVHRQLICSADPNLWKIRDLLALIEVGNDSATLLMPVNYNIRLRPRWIVSWEHFAKPACLKVSCVSLMIQSNLSDSFFLANCSILIKNCVLLFGCLFRPQVRPKMAVFQQPPSATLPPPSTTHHTTHHFMPQAAISCALTSLVP